MLNSDLDLDANLSPVNRSTSPTARQIVPEFSIDARLSSRCPRSISMPIFAEAAAQAARLTDAPVAVLTTIAGAGYRISAICGAGKFAHLVVNSDSYSELSGLEYCHTHTINSGGRFLVANFQNDPQLAHSQLYYNHQLQAYLGVPIITVAGDLLGTLSILDVCPRQFSDREIEILQLTSRLVACEFDRKQLSQLQLERWVGELQYSSSAVRGFDDLAATVEHDRREPTPLAGEGGTNFGDRAATASLDDDLVVTDKHCWQDRSQTQNEIQFKLLTHLAQELRTPLTSVLGMASVLQQEIYGALSGKQKDYLGIIYHSGQQLVTIVNEISQLGGFASGAAGRAQQLTLKSVDLEMLCRLAIQSLEPLAQKKHQQIVLDLSSANALSDPASECIWLLDKDNVRQIVYYLTLSLIHRTAHQQQIAIRLANLMDGLQLQFVTSDERVILENLQPIDPTTSSELLASPVGEDLRIRLGLSLSQTLATIHGGEIEVLPDRRGYQLSLPLIVPNNLVGSSAARLF